MTASINLLAPRWYTFGRFVWIRTSRRNFTSKDISVIANGGTKIALYCLLIRSCQPGLNEPSRDKFDLENLVLHALGTEEDDTEEHCDQESGLNKFGLGELGLIYPGHGQHKRSPNWGLRVEWLLLRKPLRVSGTYKRLETFDFHCRQEDRLLEECAGETITIV